jgi:hypothetical protein
VSVEARLRGRADISQGPASHNRPSHRTPPIMAWRAATVNAIVAQRWQKSHSAGLPELRVLQVARTEQLNSRKGLLTPLKDAQPLSVREFAKIDRELS